MENLFKQQQKKNVAEDKDKYIFYGKIVTTVGFSY
jgi:hypothetical protein